MEEQLIEMAKKEIMENGLTRRQALAKVGLPLTGKYIKKLAHVPRRNLIEEKIIEAYKQGKTVREIYATTNISLVAIYKYLKKNGVKLEKLKISQETRQKIRDLHKSGISKANISRLLGISEISVRKILQENPSVAKGINTTDEKQEGGQYAVDNNNQGEQEIQKEGQKP